MNKKDYEKIGRLVAALAKTGDGVRFDRDSITDAGCDCCVDIRTEGVKEITPEALEEYACEIARVHLERRRQERKKKKESKAFQKKMQDPVFAAEYREKGGEAEKKWKEDMFSTLDLVFTKGYDSQKWKSVFSDW